MTSIKKISSKEHNIDLFLSVSYLSHDHEPEIKIPQILMSASYIDIYVENEDEDRLIFKFYGNSLS
jgi:hypothetical protein